MKGTIDNPRYRRMLRPQSAVDRISYLEFMIDFYFKVIIALGKVGFKNQFRAQMATSLQMMFTKAKSMRQLLEGYSHKEKDVVINRPADHTILFTLVRAAYEQLCAFELVLMIPDTDDKRTIMENVYVAAAQVKRLKLFTEEALLCYPEEAALTKQDIEDCKKAICETSLFQHLTEKEQSKLIKTVFERGEYQVVFTDEGKLKPKVGWDEVRDFCKLNTDTLYGVYNYACNMAHPSYLGLIQFNDAYKEGAIGILNQTAIMEMIGIMSVFVMDFLVAYPEAQHVYDELDEESQYMVRAYSESFRDTSN